MSIGSRTVGGLVGVALGLVAAGCGEERLRPPPPPERPAARVVVTHDFGSTPVRDLRVAPDQSVLAALQGVTTVDVRAGYVQAIDGAHGSLSRRRDWLYFVNGVQADVGAAEYRLGAGDVTWWDLRSWRRYMHVPAVVGSWPEPFLHGFRGRPAAVAADPPLDAVLRDLGVRLVEQDAPYRVRVAADAALRRRDPAWRRAVADPARAGLTAWIDRGRVRVWNAGRGAVETVPEARAVAAAVPVGDGAEAGVLLAVVGVDEAAATRAATAVAARPAYLERRYAVAFDGEGRPVAAGGTGRLP